MTEAGCWAHARRKIHDVYISTKSATAEEALKLIGELYTIEHEIRGLPVSEHLAARQMQSKPLLASLYKLMQEKEHTGRCVSENMSETPEWWWGVWDPNPGPVD